MSDAAPQQSPSPAVSATDARTLAIIVYGLYLGGIVTGGCATIAGVILAYVKRDESQGTVWYSHFENAIQAFWMGLILFVIGIATAWFLVGIPVLIFAGIYFLYRTIKGLVAAIESRPYV